MGAGRKTQTLTLKEKTQPKWTVNGSVSARHLSKSDLGAVIFGCKHKTIKECKLKQLFGLPAPHFSYVKNVTPGLTLFLFNYSDRKLHGIYEAASPGRLNINPYGWTVDGTERTPYPAQVQVRVRKQCRPLLEEEFAPIIADNYYEPALFWFELDRTQTSKLMDLFSSSPSMLPAITPCLPNSAAWSTIFNSLPTSDANDVRDEVKASVNNLGDMGTELETWETSTNPKGESGCSYASVLSSKNTSLPQKPWISLFKASSASGRLQKVETLNTQASKVLPVSDNLNKEWESSCVSSSMHREDEHFEACSDEWDAESYEEPVDLKSSSMDYPILENITDPLSLSSSNEFLPIVDGREESGCVKSMASQLHLQQPHEPNTEWEMPFVTNVLGGDGRPLEASMDNDGKNIHNGEERYVKDSVENHDRPQPLLSVGKYAEQIAPSVACTANELRSSDFLSVVVRLMREIGDLKVSQSKQNLKISSLEKELIESNLEILQLRNQYTTFSYRPTSSSSGQIEEVDFEAFKPCPDFDNSIIIVGGYDASTWLSDLSLYSPTHDLIKSLGSMTFLRSYTSAAKLNGELYLFGGVNGDIWYDTVESYNLTHNDWVTRPSLNQKKGSLAGVSLFGKLFAIGGGNGVECFSEVEMFDMNIGKWIFTQSMQQKRFAPAVAEINGALYVVGGYNGADYLKSVERFDPREPKWTGLGSMSTKRGCHSLIALNEKLYALGGYDGERMVSTVEVFDPRVCSWMMGESMKDARGYAGAVVIGEKIYAIGGLKDSEEILETVECYKEGYGWQVTNLKAMGKRCFFSALVL
ncbi:hypothetical protein ACH5RR_016854 [Cinchona calisaya]|uniref:DCD domain-containing protein n=1 Tax=Cinchona calisaya TaxID=153742 RepID=A0ABD3A0C0_9GENT